jgi:hypothetical protein
MVSAKITVDEDATQLDTEVTMTDEQRLNLYVRTMLCGAECIANRELDTIARNFKCGVSSSQNGRMTTWVPQNAIPILIIGSNGDNIVITCKSGVAYKMSPVMEIPPLPEGVIIVGNCTMDFDDTFRVLIYDADNIPGPSHDANGVKLAKHTTLERYSVLRQFYPHFFEVSKTAKSTFVLQWVGFYESAAAFLTGKLDVGHKVGGLVSTTDDVLTPTRPVAVKVPGITIKRFRED